MVASVIIGIHGLANKPPADEKKEWWKRALIEGLKRNCAKTTDTLSFDFVYWADLRYNPPISLEMNPEPYYPDDGVGSFPAYQTHKWVAVFNEITSVIGKEVNFLDLHTGVDKVGDFVLERELQDLAAYYEDENFRRTARQRLLDKLREHAGKRIMLIGHSMGSIIAYDVLRIIGRETPPVSVDHFVTIGSPLGLPHVKTKIYEENDLVRTPSVVHLARLGRGQGVRFRKKRRGNRPRHGGDCRDDHQAPQRPLRSRHVPGPLQEALRSG